ncbi:HNH endonuclease [Vibrio parahaemolyticus]
MLFNEHLKNHFTATEGAGSIVTKREATGDKSVTVDKEEKSVLFTIYPSGSFTRAGGAAADGKPNSQTFKVLNPATGKYESHKVAIKYPKANPKKMELRLYFSRGSHFYPNENDYWYVFTRTGEDIPYIGFMSSGEWENISSGIDEAKAFEENYALDEDDELFQKEIHSPQAQAGKTETSTTKYPRSPAKAANAIKKSKYKCQFNSDHDSFISGASLKAYVEVHHLVPLSSSDKFTVSLDVPANLIVLCPNCHRAIHFGTAEIKKEYLEKFYHERRDTLEQSGIRIKLEDLFEFYNIKS